MKILAEFALDEGIRAFDKLIDMRADCEDKIVKIE